MKRGISCGFLILWLGATVLCAQSSPKVSPLHNLATTQSSDGSLACIYCHTSHNAVPQVKGVWNHEISNSNYSAYMSSTYKQGVETVTATSSSRLCMSCHDGTVALGATYNSGTVTNAVRVPLSSAGNLGVDLSRSHPFAFEQWNKNASLVDSLFNATARATANPKVKLSDGRIECVTCHEPHVQDIDPMRPTDFLVADNRRGAICLACHDANKPSPAVLAGWQSSAHAVSTSREGANVTGYPTVGDGACGNCHVEHRSGSARLLRAAEEQTCYSCHANPNSNYRWGRAWLGYDQKNYRHPIQVEGHEPNENLLSAGTPRHSKCWDCHNSHAALDNGKSAPNSLGSALVGADGMRSDGTAITPATAEYQVCLKCHGDSNNKPQKAGFADYGYTPVRSVSAFNVRRDFNSEIARHNVIHPFSGAAYPDLRDNILMLNGAAGRPLKTSGSFLKCSDCHNGDDPSSDGGSGPNGPHMSSNPHLLERPYALNEAPNPGQPVRSLIVTLNPRTGTFALCEKCHDVAGLLGNGTTAGPRDSVFKHHGSHVLNMGISCSVCHSPHGVDNGTQQFNAHSINLDTQLTGPDPGTQKWYIDTITRTCYVKCHFTNDQGIPVVHSGVSYALMASTPQVRPLKPAPRK